MTDVNTQLQNLVEDFIAKSATVSSAEEVEALNKDADQKLLEIANGDQETFLNLRKQAANLMTDKLIKDATEKAEAELKEAAEASEEAVDTVVKAEEDAPAAE